MSRVIFYRNQVTYSVGDKKWISALKKFCLTMEVNDFEKSEIKSGMYLCKQKKNISPLTFLIKQASISCLLLQLLHHGKDMHSHLTLCI